MAAPDPPPETNNAWRSKSPEVAVSLPGRMLIRYLIDAEKMIYKTLQCPASDILIESAGKNIAGILMSDVAKSRSISFLTIFFISAFANF